MIDITSGGKMPQARTSDLVLQNLDSEVLVYDLLSDKAHQLNETMSLIWKKCDGKATIDEVIQLLKKTTNSDIGEDFIALAISELEKLNLLVDVQDGQFGEISRRDIAFKYAPMAVALPIVVSLVAPSAVQAQSCTDPSQPCTQPSDCCSNNCFTDLGGPGVPQCLIIV